MHLSFPLLLTGGSATILVLTFTQENDVLCTCCLIPYTRSWLRCQKSGKQARLLGTISPHSFNVYFISCYLIIMNQCCEGTIYFWVLFLSSYQNFTMSWFVNYSARIEECGCYLLHELKLCFARLQNHVIQCSRGQY